MAHSDDDEDFLSADEGEEEIQLPKLAIKAPTEVLADSDCPEKSNSSPIKRHQIDDEDAPVVISDSIDDERNTTIETNTSDSTSNRPAALEENLTARLRDDVDEDAIAERIRERNLRIARKFSAQIAKTVQASAPIPMATSQSQLEASLDATDVDTSNSSADSKCVGSLPRAPPPTPALSSSLNNSELLSNPPSNLQDTTKYGWRIPANPADIGPKLAQNTTLSPSSKNEQAARLALDRLSERLSQSDNNRNLFEKVAEDIKKVSLSRDEKDSAESSGIPIISDLGSTLGTFGWNSASKFFSSATQVTSRVGTSVLDSVVNVTQQATRSKDETTDPNQKVTTSTETRLESQNVDRGSSSIQSPDAIVDLTLDAMESLGKKAFSVMTERDESGSIQIKGLGRPWEHLMNITKQSSISDSSTCEVPEQADEHEVLETFQTTTPSDLTYNSTSGSQAASGLKNRRKRLS